VENVRPWIKRHPILTGFSGIFGLLFIVSFFNDPGSALLGYGVIFAIIWFIAWGVDRRKGYDVGKRAMTVPARTITSSPWPSTPAFAVPTSPRHTSPKGQRNPIQSNQTFLTGLDNTTRIGIINMLQLDEAIRFVLQGANGTLVGTDRALLLIPPGRKGFERRTATSYFSIRNVRIDPSRHGGHLRFDVGGETHQLHLINQNQLDRGLMAAQEIRQLAHDAQVTEEEVPTPATESAYAETAHRTVPTASAGMKTLSLGDMLAMTPNQFEELTGKALEAMGYQEMKVSGGAGDLAADLHGKDPQGRSVIVQCKRYAPGNRVGSPAVQQFIGMKAIHHKADRGIYVTTADYSQQAIDLANQHDIVLIDGDDLVKITALLLASGTTLPTPGVGARFCTQCGTQNESPAKFCAGCGTALSPAT